MTLEEAIKILERGVSRSLPNGEIDYNEACKLGIAGLKELKRLRQIYDHHKGDLLLSETLE